MPLHNLPIPTTEHQFTMKAGVSKKSGEIADMFAPTYKLKADNSTDTVQGFVWVNGNDIRIVIYDADENPVPRTKDTLNRWHNTTLRKPLISPSRASLEATLRTNGVID